MRVRRPLRIATAALSVALGSSLVVASASPALAAPVPAVRPAATPVDFFGMHVNSLGSARSLPSKNTVGSVRLWDTGTTWADIQPARGQFTWTKLDAAVAQAVRNRQKPLIVLGQTPTWASSAPTLVTGGLPAGATATPNRLSDWRAYVQAVVARYSRRGVTDFQTWNEPNGGLFFTGTMKQLAALNLAAYQVVHATTVKKVTTTVKGKKTTRSVAVRTYPTARLVGPGFSTRLKPGLTKMRDYLRAPGGNKVDVFALHLYALPRKAPETTLTQLAAARTYLTVAKLAATPLWVTEVSFGGAIGGSQNKPEVISSANQASYLSRFLLLAAANGISRVYWYAWDVHGVLGIELTKSDNRSLTDAGRALTVTRGWMANPLTGCVRDRVGTYTCTVTPRRGHGYIVWNPTKRARIAAPLGTVSVTSVLGVRKAVKPKAPITVTTSPQYVSSTL